MAMIIFKKQFFFILLCFCIPVQMHAQSNTNVPINPVNPNASPEVKELLNYIYSISGKQVLAGQHCAPLVGSTRLSVVHRITKKYPAVFGQDFGFSFPGYWDGINYRQNIVDEAIKRSEEGFIITLMWHAVPPTMDEPVTFKDAIQSDLSDKEWQDLVTPGTFLNEKWKSQVDVIAWFLKQLRFAEVPVIWRPYHEMNGDWFWWGKKKGENGYKKLYRMLFDRLVNFHGLDNLIWVYNTNEFKQGVDRHDEYYPGDDVVDILATDVYTEGFNQENYLQLKELAGNKPIALGEVGSVPSPELLKEQNQWVWFMQWGEPDFDREPLKNIYESDNVNSLYDLPWVNIDNPEIHYPILKQRRQK